MPKTKTEEMSLTTLFQNEGVVEKLFTMLPVKDLMSINQVDKALHAATNREEVWKLHWRKLVGANATEPASFKEACREIIKNLYQEERAKKEQANIGEFLSSLPDETLISILSFLDMAELSKVGRTSKYLKKLSEDDGLWSAFIKKRFNVEPPKNQPMKAYFRHLKSNILKEKFLKEYPEVVLTAPKEERKPKKPFLPFGENYLEWLCFAGNKAELEAFLSNYKHKNLGKPSAPEEKNIGEIVRLINLALENKNCPEAFLLLINSLSFENRAALVSDCGGDKDHFYVILNFIKFGIPLELVRDKPVLVPIIISRNPSEPQQFRFIKFLVAYNISCVEQETEGKTPFYLACENKNLELVKYFVFEVSQVTQAFFTLGEDSWINFILRALREAYQFPKDLTSWMDILAHLIRLFPKLLEKEVPSGFYATKSVAESILFNCMQTGECTVDWSRYKELFIAIDHYFFRQNKSTLLHYLAHNIHKHPMLDFWLKTRAQKVIEKTKYIDFPCNDKVPLLLVYQSSMSDLIDYREAPSTLEILKLFLDAGANPNVFLNKEPLLWVLVKKQLFKTAKLFLEYGADPTYLDDSGKNPIWKESKQDPELHELIKKSYEKLGKPMPMSKAEQASQIQFLLQQNKKLMEENAAKPVKQKMIEKSTQTTEEDFQLPSAQM